MTYDEMNKRYPAIRMTTGTSLENVIKVELKNKDGLTLVSLTETDGMTIVLGDMDVKWLVCFNGTMMELKGLLRSHDTDPSFWIMKVLCSTSPVLDEMLDTDGLRRSVNGFIIKNGFQPGDYRLSAYYTDAIKDVSKLYQRVCSMPENVAMEEADKIVRKNRQWDEQFIRSLDILKYVLCGEEE